MGAGSVVHRVCTAPPQPGQEQRIPTILQRDAGTEAAAAHCSLCRYQLHATVNPFTAHVEVSTLHKMAVVLKKERVCVCMFVCRERSAAGCSGCTVIADCPHVHAAHHPGGRALGSTALSALLHR